MIIRISTNFAMQSAKRSSLSANMRHSRKPKGKIVDTLVKGHEFPVPNAYVDFQIENNVRRSVREITGRDMDLRSLKLDWDKLREQQGERATQDVKASLLLEKIADMESIHATTEEVDRELAANC